MVLFRFNIILILNRKLSNSQFNKLKSAIKNGTEVNLNLSSNLIGNPNDETSFPHQFSLTNTQVSKIRKAFENDSLANTKFSKTQLSKIVQLGGFLFSPPNIFGQPIPTKSIIDSTTNDNLVDTGLNIIDKII